MGERAVPSLEISRSDIVKHQRAFLEMAAGETVFDEGLLRAQPVERGINLTHRDGAEAQFSPREWLAVGGVKHARGGQFRRRIEQPGNDQGESEITPASRRATRQQVIEADAAGGGERGENVAVRQRAADFEAALAGQDELIAAQDGAKGFDLLGRPRGEVGEGSGSGPCRPRDSFREAGQRGASHGSGRW